MKKWFKRISIFLLVFVFLIVLAAVLVPFLFKDEIAQWVKKDLNSSLTTDVEFTDISLSLFRGFPDITFSMDNFSLVGNETFKGDTLVSMDRFDLYMDLMSVFKKAEKVDIHKVAFRKPYINLKIDKDGLSNWDIAPESKDTSAAEGRLSLRISAYEIEDGRISYVDLPGKLNVAIAELNHKGTIDIEEPLYLINTETHAKGVDYKSNGSAYLKSANIDLISGLSADLDQLKFILDKNKLTLNALQLDVDGWLQLQGDKTELDLSLKSANSDIRQLLSMIPEAFTSDFAGVKTEGTMQLSAYIKGTYEAARENYPSLGLDVKIKDGQFRYPGLPAAVNDIQLDIDARKPQGSLDKLVVNIPDGHLALDKTPVDFRLLLKTPISDPYIDGQFKGKVRLEELQAVLPLETVENLSGLLDADITAKGKLSAIEQKRYKEFDLQGDFLMSGVEYSDKSLPDIVKIDQLNLDFRPENVALKELKASMGNSDIRASGQIENLLSWFLKDDKLKGRMTVNSNNMDLNMLAGDSEASPAAKGEEENASDVIRIPEDIDFDLTVNGISTLLYDKLEMKNVSGRASIRNGVLNLTNLKGDGLGGSMLLNGSYMTKADQPIIDLNYDVKNINVEQALGAFEVLEKLAPVARFLKGSFDSKLKMSGRLDEQMNPLLTSLTGDGFAAILRADFLTQFAPFNSLMSQLKISDIDRIDLNGVKTWFTFVDGRVFLEKPVDIAMKDIVMSLNGSHGFDQSLDYRINMTVPMSKLGKASTLINDLSSQAQSFGVPFTPGENINFDVLVSGTLDKPVFKPMFRDKAASVKDELKEAAKQQVEAAKEEAMKQLEAEKDKLLEQGTKILEGEKEKIQDDLKAKGDEVKDKAGEEIKKQTQGVFEGLFGKKKKGGG